MNITSKPCLKSIIVMSHKDHFTHRCVFAGIDLNGDVVHQNAADTDSFYGKDIPYKVILEGGVSTPQSAADFVKAANELFRLGGERESSSLCPECFHRVPGIPADVGASPMLSGHMCILFHPKKLRIRMSGPPSPTD
jgi:Las17-binding protein actin regulator